MEQREQYRNTELPDSLGLTVCTSGGDRFEAEAVDLTSRGTGARFPRANMPALGLGASVTLAFESSLLRRTLELSAKVRFRGEEQEHRRYGFEFDQPEQLSTGAATALQRYFNRRSSFRVEVRPEETIGVAITVEGGVEICAELRDVSAGGIGVALAPVDDARAIAAEEVQIRFALPPSNAPLEPTARIRSRRLADEAVVYGIEFDAERTPSFSQLEERVLAYVMERQREDAAKRVR